MDRELSDFLSARREKNITVGEQTLKLRLLSARETLGLMSLVGEMDGTDAEKGLRADAELVSRCLYAGDSPAFSGGEEALQNLTAEEITETAAAFAELSRRFNASASGDRARIERLKKASGTPITKDSNGAC
jgi:hypothetical protein